MSPSVAMFEKTKQKISGSITGGLSGGLTKRLDSFSASPALTMGVKSHANGLGPCQHLQLRITPDVPACFGSGRILRGFNALQKNTRGK